MTRIVGDRVLLRPFRHAESGPLLDLARGAPIDDGVHWGPRDRSGIEQKIRASGSWTPDGQLDFAVEADGRLVGDVQARCVRGAMPPGVFELGLEIFDPDRGRGLGAAAIVEITRHLFREERAHRVQLTTDVANGAMRRVAERLGFIFEGVLKRYMPTADGPHDYAMYALTDEEFEGTSTQWI
jgi:RimJ/RimL family protein N-acetyltransferase